MDERLMPTLYPDMIIGTLLINEEPVEIWKYKHNRKTALEWLDIGKDYYISNMG
ncbi:hypothetical protein [Oceanobacillus sp. CF4.6]|uniref:hypothetical protein n=1 Tax=Oceanobacillus sp. CF4.6 TaxID=3373080 RepID=UPI003EE54D4A